LLVLEKNELPIGWEKVLLSEIAKKITDGEHLKPKFVDKGIPFLSAKDILDSGLLFDNVKYIQEKDSVKFRIKCDPKKDDILIVSRGNVGRSCLVNTDKTFCLLGSVILLRLISEMNSRYLLYFFKHSSTLQKLIKISSSTVQGAIYLRDLKNLNIPIPPLNEQKRIVSKIEELFSLIDSILKSLKKIKTQIRLYGFSFYESIFGQLEKKPLEELCELTAGQHIKKSDYNTSGNGIPYLTGPADFSDKYPTISKWTTKPKAIAKKGDILITVKGAGVGKTNILNVDNVAISRQLMAIRIADYSSIFLYNYLKSKFHELQKLGQSTTVPGISKDLILQFFVPMIKFSEQKKIVMRLDATQTILLSYVKLLQNLEKYCSSLKSTILKNTFEGKLVPQDPNDEPASELLKRIQASK